MTNWEKRAKEVYEVYGGFMDDEEERYYICPFCGETVYEEDWTDADFANFICPICEDDT